MSYELGLPQQKVGVIFFLSVYDAFQTCIQCTNYEGQACNEYNVVFYGYNCSTPRPNDLVESLPKRGNNSRWKRKFLMTGVLSGISGIQANGRTQVIRTTAETQTGAPTALENSGFTLPPPENSSHQRIFPPE